MPISRLDVIAPDGRWLRLVTGGSIPAAPCRAPAPAANDNGVPVDAVTHRLATRLLADFGSDAHHIANRRAMEAFWKGDMAACKKWTRAGRLIDTHAAGSCRQRPERALRDLMATLAAPG